MRKKHNVLAGEFIAVPLNNSEWALLLVTASNPKGLIQSVVFDCRLHNVPNLENAIRYSQFAQTGPFVHGPLGIFDGSWLRIGSFPHFVQKEWFAPLFYNSNMKLVREYEMEPFRAIGYRHPKETEVNNLPEDSVAGHIFISEYLNKNLPR